MIRHQMINRTRIIGHEMDNVKEIALSNKDNSIRCALLSKKRIIKREKDVVPGNQ